MKLWKKLKNKHKVTLNKLSCLCHLFILVSTLGEFTEMKVAPPAVTVGGLILVPGTSLLKTFCDSFIAHKEVYKPKGD